LIADVVCAPAVADPMASVAKAANFEYFNVFVFFMIMLSPRLLQKR
jgi:hypothetical protein